MTGSAALSADMKKALTAIDEVHAVPEVASPVEVTGGPRQGSARGAYFPGGNRIESYLADRRMHTLIHEFGHYLDAQAFGKVDSVTRSAADWAGASPLGRLMLSERKVTSPAWKDLWQAVESSGHYAYWSEIKKTSPLERGFAEYLLSRVELFARAYERWIFERVPATHPLKAEMRAYVQERVAAQWLWDDADFSAIAKAMDGVFKERGWLRSTR